MVTKVFVLWLWSNLLERLGILGRFRGRGAGRFERFEGLRALELLVCLPGLELLGSLELDPGLFSPSVPLS